MFLVSEHRNADKNKSFQEEKNQHIPLTSSCDYLTPQNQPTYHIIEDHHQLQNDSMFNKTKSKLSKEKERTLGRFDSSSSSSLCSERQHNNYKEIELLNHGKFWNTYKCLNKVDKIEYAMKHDHDKPNNQQCTELIREGHILSALQRRSQTSGKLCNYIIRYYKMWRESNHCYIVLEYCDHNLLTFKQQNQFNEQLLIKLILHISTALTFLHANKYIHFNINPSNILVSRDGIFKITDFKLARNFEGNNDQENYAKIPRMGQFTDDESRYLCQEIVNSTFHPQVLNKVDIFALGCVIFEILLNSHLPTLKDNKDHWIEIRNTLLVQNKLNEIGDALSNAFKQLLAGMMSINPNQRPNADLIMNALKRFEDEILRQKDNEIENLKRRYNSLMQQKRKPVGRRARLSNIYQNSTSISNNE